MKRDELPPQFREAKRPELMPLFEELLVEVPDAAAEIPPEESAPPRELEPFLRRS